MQNRERVCMCVCGEKAAERAKAKTAFIHITAPL